VTIGRAFNARQRLGQSRLLGRLVVMVMVVVMMVVMVMVMMMTGMSGHRFSVGHRNRRHGKANRQACGNSKSLDHSCSSSQSP
jgi:hypothetical protein